MNIEYSSTLTDIVEANESFDKGKLRIAYTGKNRNNSFISKESFEKAIPSMFCCPVVANYIREDEEIGSHDGSFVTKDNGDVVYVYDTQPVGFVPQNADYYFEEVTDDGVIHQYLTTEVVLWKRQEAYSKIKDNGVTKQSMEISVSDGEMCDDYYKINDFIFTAFCLLGTAEPCFESAGLFSFAQNENALKDVKKQISEMMNEFTSFSNNDKTQAKEGEEKVMTKLEELLKQYSVAMEDLEFEVEGLSDEELEIKFEETFNSDEPEQTEPVIPEDKFALDSQMHDALCEAVRAMGELEDDWGKYPKFYLVDFDCEAGEVYFVNREDWKLYGTTFVMDNDEIKIDFDGIKRKKYQIVDFVEGEENKEFSLKECVSEVVDKVIEASNNKYSELETKFNTVKTQYDLAVEKEQIRSALEVLNKFENQLGEVPEFKILAEKLGKGEMLECSAEELENKLFALVGKKNFELNNGKNQVKSPKVNVNVDAKDNDIKSNPYGDLFNFIKK